MRYIRRRPLSEETLKFLEARTQQIRDAGAENAKEEADGAKGTGRAKEEAERLWKRQNNRAMNEVRRTLEEMASGRHRCMYCEDSAGHTIDHFRPRKKAPDKAFEWENLLLACGLCNSTKEANFPVDERDDPLLLNPTLDEPLEHLRLSLQTGELLSDTRRGEETIKLFHLNDPSAPRSLPAGRLAALTAVLALLIQHAERAQAGDHEGAQRQREAVLRQPFIAVIDQLLRVAGSDDADLLLEPRALRALRAHDVAAWLREARCA